MNSIAILSFVTFVAGLHLSPRANAEDLCDRMRLRHGADLGKKCRAAFVDKDNKEIEMQKAGLTICENAAHRNTKILIPCLNAIAKKSFNDDALNLCENLIHLRKTDSLIPCLERIANKNFEKRDVDVCSAASASRPYEDILRCLDAFGKAPGGNPSCAAHSTASPIFSGGSTPTLQ